MVETTYLEATIAPKKLIAEQSINTSLNLYMRYPILRYTRE